MDVTGKISSIISRAGAAGTCVATMTYADLSEISSDWIDAFESWREKQSLGETEKKGIECVLSRLGRRRFQDFRRVANPRNEFEKALVEVFCISRIRLYSLAYLSVQEGENFEGAASYETPVPQLIGRTLRDIGKTSNVTLVVGPNFWRMRLNIDPMFDLRALYRTCLTERGSWLAWARAWWFRTAFRAKTGTMRFALRFVVRIVSRGGHRSLERVCKSRSVLENLKNGIGSLFPGSSEMSDKEWKSLLDKSVSYFLPRIKRLFEVMPEASTKDHGLVKLCKVAFGTIAGRVASRELHEKDEAEFIFNTLRLAYCWGITYPLVDNVLDSDTTSDAVRNDLVQALEVSFSADAESAYAASSDCVQEVADRMEEALSLVPKEFGKGTRNMLRLLYESHRSDSSRRLSSIRTGGPNGVWDEVLVDTTLKAALIRLATMQICGIQVDEDVLARALKTALYNQLGDDLWDIREDTTDNRVTPFTYYLKDRLVPNPFRLYLDYTALMSMSTSKRRERAVFMGFCETIRDCLDTLEQERGQEQIRGELRGLLEAVGVTSNESVWKNVPHVDFDAVLFACENAAFSLKR